MGVGVFRIADVRKAALSAHAAARDTGMQVRLRHASPPVLLAMLLQPPTLMPMFLAELIMLSRLS